MDVQAEVGGAIQIDYHHDHCFSGPRAASASLTAAVRPASVQSRVVAAACAFVSAPG